MADDDDSGRNNYGNLALDVRDGDLNHKENGGSTPTSKNGADGMSSSGSCLFTVPFMQKVFFYNNYYYDVIILFN